MAISRRTLLQAIVGASAAGLLSVAVTVDARSDDRVPIRLDGGINITDIRLGRWGMGRNAMIEISSSRDDIIDCPAIGVSDLENSVFGWLTPYSPILIPGVRNFCMGMLDPILLGGISTGEPINWVVCSAPTFSNWFRPYQQSPATIDSVTPLEQENYFEVKWSNTSEEELSVAAVYLAVLDSEHRIVGGTPSTFWRRVPPKATQSIEIGITPALTNIASPYPFISDGDRVTVSASLGPLGIGNALGCPPLMPWNNRSD